MTDSVSTASDSAHDPLCGLSQPCDDDIAEHGFCSRQEEEFCIHCHQWCICEQMREAEKNGYEKAVTEFMSNHHDRWEYRAGQADMLAKCIAAVEAWALENPYEYPSPNRIISDLRALEEKP